MTIMFMILPWCWLRHFLGILTFLLEKNDAEIWDFYNSYHDADDHTDYDDADDDSNEFVEFDKYDND